MSNWLNFSDDRAVLTEGLIIKEIEANLQHNSIQIWWRNENLLSLTEPIEE